MRSLISSQNWQHSYPHHSCPSPLCARKLPLIIDAQGNTLYIAVVMGQMLFPRGSRTGTQKREEKGCSYVVFLGSIYFGEAMSAPNGDAMDKQGEANSEPRLSDSTGW